ncbi:hypothetical protein CVT26_002872 [Gymnopilus dilepis]|uniref:Protein kinase domain-containing protein n=1 Tax=Gymnopilus dilepis TaxID=231916 RepID=A0A409VT72_9AGAR|nr:hypothetical protein CVT26_002872 [Gymnopilus dilepis]
MPQGRSSCGTDRVISDIKSGLEFLRKLGLVHDDINPRNIMLRGDGHAVIIDFDSCTAVGGKSRGGTPGWSRNPRIAEFDNDEYGLELVIKYMHGEYDGQDFEAFGF